MRKLKLILGIIAVVLGFIVLLQSCTVSIFEEIEDTETTNSGAGSVMAIIMLVAGIIGICTHKNSRWICLFLGISHSIVGYTGIQNAENFPDLEVWGGISFAFAAVYVIIFFMELSTPKDNPPPSGK